MACMQIKKGRDKDIKRVNWEKREEISKSKCKERVREKKSEKVK